MRTKTFFSTLLLFLCALSAKAQNFTVVASNLRQPLGLEIAPDGQLWLTEVGLGANDGAVSVVKPNGTLAPVIIDLASLFDTMVMEGIGPWRSITLPGKQLGVVTPLTGGISLFDLTDFVPGVTPPIKAASSTAQVPIADFVFQNQPPSMPDSDPYSVAFDAAGNWYVADAGFNGIIRVNAISGQRSVFAQFPPFTNPLPVGPPVVDQVPTRIIAKPGGGFYVCTLTGFPFLEGAASVFLVSATGTVTPYATGLTLLTDLYLDAKTGDLYALQLGKFVLDPVMPGFAPNSAKVIKIKPDGTQQTVAEGFGPSPGMAIDAQGTLYVTEIYAGRLLKKTGLVAAGEPAGILADLVVSPNPAHSEVHLSFELKETAAARLVVLDVLGKEVFAKDLGSLPAGRQAMQWSADHLPDGVYVVDLQTEEGHLQKKVVIQQ